jgi:hypothetical protein
VNPARTPFSVPARPVLPYPRCQVWEQVTLFFEKECPIVGNNQAEIPCARLINPWKIDFIQNSMTEREPDSATHLGEIALSCSSAQHQVAAAHPSKQMWGNRSVPSETRPCRARQRLLVTAVTFCVALMVSPYALADVAPVRLDDGFHRLYDLDFAGAQRSFEAWEKLNPENPMGPASEAAGILFSEFNRLGVLEAQFYENDSVFAQRKKYEADAAQRTRFDQQLTRAETLANSVLKRNPHDRDALLAMTFSAGLRSDFAALIEKKNLSSLH